MMGVVHGRFQILHNDHMKYILAGAARCSHLVVGITNPDPGLTREDGADPERSNRKANPLTYWERYCMVSQSLMDSGMDPARFSVVPFPVNLPELYANYLPMDAVFFLTIYDAWGERKLALFTQAGLVTEVLWRRPLSGKGITSTQVRQAIARNEPWDHLVPRPTAQIIRQGDIITRIKALETA